jgi:amino acid transporter
MQGRIFTLITAMVVFLVVAFTPIVPLMLGYYGIDNIFIVKTCIGIIVLGAGWMFGTALFNKDDIKKKEGKLKYKPFMILVGIALIALSWYTSVPEMLSEYTGTSEIVQENIILPVGIRIWTSILSLIGIIFIKLGIYRQKEVFVMNPKEEKENSQLYETIQKMDGEY